MELPAQQCLENFCQRSLVKASYQILIATVGVKYFGIVYATKRQLDGVLINNNLLKFGCQSALKIVILGFQKKILGRLTEMWYL